MGYRIDLTGKKFESLKVVGFSHNGSAGRTYWLVACDCGSEVKSVESYSLKTGKVKSCGCHRRNLRRKHGATSNGVRTQDYIMWQNMKARCARKNHPEYSRYGGRGITVCDEWVSDFSAFISSLPERPSKKHQIDRIDTDGNYEKGNIRWVTAQQNSMNRRATSKNKLGVKGVCEHNGRFIAHVAVNGAHVLYKKFDTVQEASDAHDEAVLKHHKEFGNINNKEKVLCQD